MALLDSAFKKLCHIDKLGLAVLVKAKSELEPFVAKGLVINVNHNVVFNQLTAAHILSPKICTLLTETRLTLLNLTKSVQVLVWS